MKRNKLITLLLAVLVVCLLGSLFIFTACDKDDDDKNDDPTPPPPVVQEVIAQDYLATGIAALLDSLKGAVGQLNNEKLNIGLTLDFDLPGIGAYGLEIKTLLDLATDSEFANEFYISLVKPGEAAPVNVFALQLASDGDLYFTSGENHVRIPFNSALDGIGNLFPNGTDIDSEDFNLSGILNLAKGLSSTIASCLVDDTTIGTYNTETGVLTFTTGTDHLATNLTNILDIVGKLSKDLNVQRMIDDMFPTLDIQLGEFLAALDMEIDVTVDLVPAVDKTPAVFESIDFVVKTKDVTIPLKNVTSITYDADGNRTVEYAKDDSGNIITTDFVIAADTYRLGLGIKELASIGGVTNPDDFTKVNLLNGELKGTVTLKNDVAAEDGTTTSEDYLTFDYRLRSDVNIFQLIKDGAFTMENIDKLGAFEFKLSYDSQKHPNQPGAAAYNANNQNQAAGITADGTWMLISFDTKINNNVYVYARFFDLTGSVETSHIRLTFTIDELVEALSQKAAGAAESGFELSMIVDIVKALGNALGAENPNEAFVSVKTVAVQLLDSFGQNNATVAAISEIVKGLTYDYYTGLNIDLAPVLKMIGSLLGNDPTVMGIITRTIFASCEDITIDVDTAVWGKIDNSGEDSFTDDARRESELKLVESITPKAGHIPATVQNGVDMSGYYADGIPVTVTYTDGTTADTSLQVFKAAPFDNLTAGPQKLKLYVMPTNVALLSDLLVGQGIPYGLMAVEYDVTVLPAVTEANNPSLDISDVRMLDKDANVFSALAPANGTAAFVYTDAAGEEVRVALDNYNTFYADGSAFNSSFGRVGSFDLKVVVGGYTIPIEGIKTYDVVFNQGWLGSGLGIDGEKAVEEGANVFNKMISTTQGNPVPSGFFYYDDVRGEVINKAFGADNVTFKLIESWNAADKTYTVTGTSLIDADGNVIEGHQEAYGELKATGSFYGTEITLTKIVKINKTFSLQNDSTTAVGGATLIEKLDKDPYVNMAYQMSIKGVVGYLRPYVNKTTGALEIKHVAEVSNEVAGTAVAPLANQPDTVAITVTNANGEDVTTTILDSEWKVKADAPAGNYTLVFSFTTAAADAEVGERLANMPREVEVLDSMTLTILAPDRALVANTKDTYVLGQSLSGAVTTQFTNAALNTISTASLSSLDTATGIATLVSGTYSETITLKILSASNEDVTATMLGGNNGLVFIGTVDGTYTISVQRGEETAVTKSFEYKSSVDPKLEIGEAKLDNDGRLEIEFTYTNSKNVQQTLTLKWSTDITTIDSELNELGEFTNTVSGYILVDSDKKNVLKPAGEKAVEIMLGYSQNIPYYTGGLELVIGAVEGVTHLQLDTATGVVTKVGDGYYGSGIYLGVLEFTANIGDDIISVSGQFQL